MPSRWIAATAFVFVSVPALAWNASGHMVIAAIAERNLRPEIRLEAERLLKFGVTSQAYDFITGSAWADDIRPQRQNTAPWHFINHYFRLDGKPTDKKPAPESILTAIDHAVATLRDHSKPELDRADALRFLIHFVGDAHQPLHATALVSDQHPEGDRGGNDYKIKTPSMFSRETRPPTNLHALWDRGVGLFPDIERPLSPANRQLIEVQAITLIAALPLASLDRGTPPLWTRESLAIARQFVYSTSEGGEVSAAYLRAGQSISARRATEAVSV